MPSLRFKFQPVVIQRVPEWADANRRLPAATTAVPGMWRTSAVELQRGPLMAWDEPGVRQLVLAFAVQCGKTECVLNIIGRTADLDPAPMMLVTPKEASTAKYSRERIGPMIRESASLSKKFEPRTRMGEDTILFKEFTGGFLALESAGSPMNLAARAIRYIFMDEIDKFEITKEGEPVALAMARQATYGTLAKTVLACSPSLTNASRIWQNYIASDQRRAFIPCEHCGHEFSPGFFAHVEWTKSETGQHFPATAAIYCPSCGSAMTEDHRRKCCTTKGGIKWKQTRRFSCCGVEVDPIASQSWVWDAENMIGRASCPSCGKLGVSNEIAGFNVSQLLSPFTTVVALATDWIKAKDNPEDKMTFRNTRLGEIADTEMLITDLQIADLMQRREQFPNKIPDEVVAIFAGVDIQTGSEVSAGSFHCYLWGITLDRQLYSIHHKIIEGDVREPTMWEALDKYLNSQFEHETAGPIGVLAACLDAGDGKISDIVTSWCKQRFTRRFWATKGMSEKPGAKWAEPWPGVKPDAARVSGYKIKLVGTNSARLAIYERLENNEPGTPGYMHFGMDWTPAMFEQLTAEKLTAFKRGEYTFRKFVLPRGRANEALDATALALIAFHGWVATGKSLERNRRFLDSLKGAEHVLQTA